MLLLVAALAISLTACGGKKTVEIMKAELNEARDTLFIEYTAKGDIAASEGAFKVTVSNGAGSVYCKSELQNDLKKGQQYILPFTMHPVAGQIEWRVGKTIQLAGGTRITDSITTDDILALFGDSAEITVSFQVNGKDVTEVTATKP